MSMPPTCPMPGPPECVCGQCTTHECLEYPHWCAQCPVHGADAHDAALKRLTDAECAAEYWRASYHLARPLAANTFVPTPEWDRARQEAATWHRFATRPHALED